MLKSINDSFNSFQDLTKNRKLNLFYADYYSDFFCFRCSNFDFDLRILTFLSQFQSQKSDRTPLLLHFKAAGKQFCSTFVVHFAEMKTCWTFFLFLLLSPSLGEDTGESQCVLWECNLKTPWDLTFCCYMLITLVLLCSCSVSAAEMLCGVSITLHYLEMTVDRAFIAHCDWCLLWLFSGGRHRHPSAGAFSGIADIWGVRGPSIRPLSSRGEHFPETWASLAGKKSTPSQSSG